MAGPIETEGPIYEVRCRLEPHTGHNTRLIEFLPNSRMESAALSILTFCSNTLVLTTANGADDEAGWGAGVRGMEDRADCRTTGSTPADS